MNKINYDDYFLSMCYLVAQRSPDPSTKCGAVLVSEDKRILSTGYNGPIKGVDDALVPLERPAKYAHLLHAEENCLLSYNGSSHDLIGSTMYITGEPCHKCLRMIIQKGVPNITFSNGNLAVMQDKNERDTCESILDYSKWVNVKTVYNLPEICHLLNDATEYIIRKNQEKLDLKLISWKLPKPS
jgi:dCMP deaminase